MKTQHDYWQEAHDSVMDQMAQDPLWKSMVHAPSNTIRCLAGGEEMLRVASDGFWVRGKQVKQDDNEAETVYNAFKAWMIWAQLNRDYK